MVQGVPLFEQRSDVLAFAFWPFLLGSIFFVLLILNVVTQ